MQLKQIFAALSVIALLATTCAVLADMLPDNTKVLSAVLPVDAESAPVYPTAAVADIDDLPSGYIVRTVDGKVGLYTADGSTLLKTLPIIPETLRAADAELFAEGIYVADEHELALLIEDFSN